MSDEDMTDLHTETLSCTQQIFVQGKKDPAKMTHTIMALIKRVQGAPGTLTSQQILVMQKV